MPAKGLDRRRIGPGGALAHQDAVVEQLQSTRKEQHELDRRREDARQPANPTEDRNRQE